VRQDSLLTLSQSAGPPAPHVGDAKAASVFYFVKGITEASHPACGQMGMFAKKSIPKGTFIVSSIIACSRMQALNLANE
jgi:hypothetical protein